MPRIVAKIGGSNLKKSGTSTPAPSDADVITLAERLNFADAPRPFKNPHFISRLGQRTATSSTTGVKKNAKQILVLERERVSGGDGFLSAAQVLQKARGEPIDIGKKRKGLPGGSGGGNSGSFGHGGNKKGSGGMQNVLKGRMKKALAAAAAESAGRGEGVPPMLMSQGAAGGSGTGGEGNGTETGLTTPGTSFAAAGGESGMTSGMVTPRNGDGDLNGQWQGEEGEEDVTMDNVNGIVHGNGEVGGVQVEGYVTEADIMPKGEVFTYHTPTAPPSLLPPKKYCDITGLHAAYTDPRTKLRYKGLDVWHVVRGLGPGSDQAYLALRGAQTSLK